MYSVITLATYCFKLYFNNNHLKFAVCTVTYNTTYRNIKCNYKVVKWSMCAMSRKNLTLYTLVVWVNVVRFTYYCVTVSPTYLGQVRAC